MNGFIVAFTVMFIPFYFSVLVAVIIKALFLFKERLILTPCIMIGGALITFDPALTFFKHMLTKISEVI